MVNDDPARLQGSARRNSPRPHFRPRARAPRAPTAAVAQAQHARADIHLETNQEVVGTHPDRYKQIPDGRTRPLNRERCTVSGGAFLRVLTWRNNTRRWWWRYRWSRQPDELCQHERRDEQCQHRKDRRRVAQGFRRLMCHERLPFGMGSPQRHFNIRVVTESRYRRAPGYTAVSESA